VLEVARETLQIRGGAIGPACAGRCDSARSQAMRRFIIVAVVVGSITGCHDKRDLSEENLGSAISAYLAEQRPLCLGFKTWPVDLPQVEGPFGSDLPKLRALEKAGLVAGTNEVVPSKVEPGRSTKIARFVLTDGGKGFLGPGPGGADICYGKVRLGRVEKWRDSGTRGHTVATYSYEIAELPTWARNRDVMAAFSKLSSKIASAGKPTNHVSLELMNTGWQVDEGTRFAARVRAGDDVDFRPSTPPQELRTRL
jgi:hypothetical protein